MERRISVSIRDVDSLSSRSLSLAGEIWLGPLKEGDLFVVASDLRGEDRPIRASVEQMISNTGNRLDEAERGSSVRLVLSGDGLDAIRPGDVLLGERQATDT
jgi:hypothetical protein